MWLRSAAIQDTREDWIYLLCFKTTRGFKKTALKLKKGEIPFDHETPDKTKIIFLAYSFGFMIILF